ncbi:MAG: hypothetical protein ABGX20_05605 [Bacillus sp. (in: firmicutes)]
MKQNRKMPKQDIKPMKTPIYDLLPLGIKKVMTSNGYKIKTGKVKE